MIEYRRHNIWHSKMSGKSHHLEILLTIHQMVPECTGTERRGVRLDGGQKGKEKSHVLLEGGHLPSELVPGQGQLLEEDNKGHLIPFRNRPQSTRGKPILGLLFS